MDRFYCIFITSELEFDSLVNLFDVSVIIVDDPNALLSEHFFSQVFAIMRQKKTLLTDSKNYIIIFPIKYFHCSQEHGVKVPWQRESYEFLQ